MIGGILIVLALGAAGAVAGLFVGDWWASRMTGAELEALWPPILGFIAGGGAGLSLGVWIAYSLGRRREP